MLSSLIAHRARPRQLIFAGALYLPMAVLVFGWPGLVARVSRACGKPPFDTRAFWNARDARAMVDSCGGGGRTAYLHLQLADLVYPAALAWLLLVVCALLLRRFGGRTWPILLPILVMTVLDYTENIGVWTLLLRWPHVPAAVADVAGVATAIKRVAGFVAFSTPIVLGVVEIAARVRRRFVTGEPGDRHPRRDGGFDPRGRPNRGG